MDRRRAAGALLALAACIACSTAAPTASNQTALDLYEGSSEGCYYNFQRYGEGDRIMTNEPCLNCTCHNKMLMCYLKVCPFTKPIGQDCTIEKRADQCCPIVTCPDVPVDLLTSTSTSSPAEYGATGLGKVDRYGCSINGKYFPEGSKVPPTPNKPCEHCYCIRNMTTCVMQECTLHVDGCTPIYHKDVCCPVRYSCDHLEDEMLLLDDMTTTVRPTPGFLLTTTTVPSVTQISQNCVHDDQIFADGALIKTEVACEHCYCMKGDIVCVVQECGTPMENEGKNCTSLPPRQGQCCPDTYICEGDELLTEPTTGITYEELTTLTPPRRVEGSGYRNEPDEPYTELPTFEGSGEEHATTLDSIDIFTSQTQTPQIIDEIFSPTEVSLKPSLTTVEPEREEQNTVPDDSDETTGHSELTSKTTLSEKAPSTALPTVVEVMKETDEVESKTTISEYPSPSNADTFTSKDDEFIMTTESVSYYTADEGNKITEMKPATGTTESINIIEEVTSHKLYPEPSSSEASTVYEQDDKTVTKLDEISQSQATTLAVPVDSSDNDLDDKDKQTTYTYDKDDKETTVTTTESRSELSETTSVNPIENEIDEDILPPGRIPGEGDCLLNGVTYKNNTNVPNINNCHSSCKCVSSIVKCDPIICSPPPEHMDNMNDCQPIFDTPDACCPTYVCHSRETIPPESHSQMSGTESPKPSIENECQGEQCQPDRTKPVPSELCNSGNCETVNEDQEKDCKNGACEYPEPSINTASPPLKHPEDCIGDTCLPSVSTEVSSCTDGKCQPTSNNDILCDNENGCQPSQACEGNNCVVGSDVASPTSELPICKDSEDCKIIDTSNCDGSKCDTSSVDTQTPNENIVPVECTDESCRRNEQSEDNKSPPDCSGSSCITKEVKDESGAPITESGMKDETYKETTTEVMKDIYSKSPESEETPSDATQKVTHFDTTESQDISPERSTEKSQESSVEDISQSSTEKEEIYPETHTTKTEETITEIYNKQETDYYQTLIPETYTTKSQGQVTESIEDIIKDTSTGSPLATQYDEHLSDLPKEDLPMKPSTTSSETINIEVHDHEKDKADVTEPSIKEQFTQVQEISTKPADILATIVPETGVTEQEDTSKQEVITELPKEYSTHSEDAQQHVTENQGQTTVETQDKVNTEILSDVLTTESSVEHLPEMSTEKQIDIQVNNDDITVTEVHDEVTDMPVQITTEPSIKIQESSEPHEIKLDDTVTTKVDNEIEKEHISTITPNIFTEVIPTDTTVQDQYNVHENTVSSQMSDIEIDTSIETTKSSITDQENLSKPTEIYNAITDIPDTYTVPTETQQYVTSVSSLSYDTQPSTTKQDLFTQTHDIPIVQEGEPNLSESPIKESSTFTVPQDIKEITTQQPETSVTDLQEETTDVNDAHNLPSVTGSDKLEQHYTPVKELSEVSTITPDETLQDDTKQKESSYTESHENDITTNIIPINELEITPKPVSTDGLPTTISSILSQKDQETSTEFTDIASETKPSKESTLLPEAHATVEPEESTLSAASDNKPLETSTSSQIENEAVTTESIKPPHEDKTEVPEIMSTSGQTPGPSIHEQTLTPAISYTETSADSNDKTISVTMDETKTDEMVPYTTPEIDQVTQKQDTLMVDDQTTGVTGDDDMNIDSSKDKHIPTEYTISNDMESQNIATQSPEAITQSQVKETKLPVELQTTQETLSTPAHVEHKEQTEAPLSLVTEPLEEDDVIDKTTQVPEENVPNEEEIKTPDHFDTKPQIPYTESPQSPITENKLDSDTPSQTYSEKESDAESLRPSSFPEYTTTKVLGIHDDESALPITENTYLDVSTEAAEKTVATAEYQDTVQTPDKTDSELHPTDVLHESTSGAPIPISISSEESLSTEEHDISTKYSEISGSVTTVSYDHESDKKPEQEHNLEDATEQSENKVDIVTMDSTTSKTLKEDHEDKQQEDDKVDVQETEPVISPEVLTTKYPQALDNNQDKLNEELEPTKFEDFTLTPEQHITTAGEIYTEKPASPGIEIQSSVDQNDDKSTAVSQTSEEKEITTPAYQDLTTLKEVSIANVPEFHISPADISTTESSEILPSEDDNRRTLSPISGTEQPEQYTTDQQMITNYPESTKTQEIGQADDLEKIFTPEKESTTLVSSMEEFVHVTPILSATEGNVILDTETVPSYHDQKLPADTENIDKYTTETHDATLKPETDSETITDKTTVQDDLIKVPVDTAPVEIPFEHTVAQESQTESSLPKETEISMPTETESSMPSDTVTDLPTKTEISTDSSILDDTEIIVPKVTEASVPVDSEPGIAEVTETSVPEETEPAVHKLPGDSIVAVTDASVPEKTEPAVHKLPEDSVAEVTEASVPEETEPAVHKLPEDFVAEVTEASVPEETEPAVHKLPEDSVAVVTEASVPEETEPAVHKLPEDSVAEVTEVSATGETEPAVHKLPEDSVAVVTEASVPEETEPAVHKLPEDSIAEVTEASATEETEPAVHKLPEDSIAEVTEASVPEETEPVVHKLPEDFVAEVTEASVPKEPESDVHKLPEDSIAEVTEASVPEESEPAVHKLPEDSKAEVTEASVPEETEPAIHKLPEDSIAAVTEGSMSEETEPSVHKLPEDSKAEVTEASVPDETEPSIHKLPEDSIAAVTEGSISEETEPSVHKLPEDSMAEVTEVSVPEETEPTVHKLPEGSTAEVTEASMSEETEPAVHKLPEDSVTEVTATSMSEETEHTVHKVPEDTISEVTEASVTESSKPMIPGATEVTQIEITEPSADKVTTESLPKVSEESVAKVTEESVAEVTESFVPDVTDLSAQKETESEVTNSEPEGTTYKPSDEKLEASVELSSTSDPIHSSSETTPYLVELQEHTTKVDEDTISVTVTAEDITKTPETYQTERGDQPFENLPDKFTQQDEQLTTLPPIQASVYTEKISDKTELVTEEVSISSESPVPTESNVQTETQTVSSGEKTVTGSPTVSIPYQEHEKLTTTGSESETSTDKKELPLGTEKIPELEVMHETTSSGDATIPVVTKAPITKTPEDITTIHPVVDNKYTETEDKPSESYSPTIAPEVPKPGVNEIQPVEEVPSPDFPPSGSSGYGQEPDYVEEDQAFGPGTCRYGGKVYVSAQQIPRDDPCDFCFCFRSDIICLQQSCPPPIHGCHEEPIQGFCCPRYECPVSMATTLNVTTTTTTTTTTLPPHFLPHAYKGAAQRRGCQIKGHSYKVGEVVRASSGPCLHCTCGGDGQMKCDPKACTPEPMLRQMIAAAVSAKRRR